jgi:predicted lipid-binding transport protein (Tim44 family)
MAKTQRKAAAAARKRAPTPVTFRSGALGGMVGWLLGQLNYHAR